MKYFTVSMALSIMLLSLSACDDKSEQVAEVSSVQEPIIIDSEKMVIIEESPSLAINQQENNNQEEPEQPLALIDFRDAINSVVQESIQEEVEKAVENEISKTTEK